MGSLLLLQRHSWWEKRSPPPSPSTLYRKVPPSIRPIQTDKQVVYVLWVREPLERSGGLFKRQVAGESCRCEPSPTWMQPLINISSSFLLISLLQYRVRPRARLLSTNRLACRSRRRHADAFQEQENVAGSKGALLLADPVHDADARLECSVFSGY